MPYQVTLEDLWLGQENNSEDSTREPIIRYVKPLPRASPIIPRKQTVPAVDIDDGKTTIKKFKITVRGEP